MNNEINDLYKEIESIKAKHDLIKKENTVKKEKIVPLKKTFTYRKAVSKDAYKFL